MKLLRNYLKSIDIDYRIWHRRYLELKKKEQTKAEKQEFENLKILMAEKESQMYPGVHTEN